MNIEEAIEWITTAENDFDSATILNNAVHKHCEIICYHCAQAAEKYLKGYLVFNNIIPEKTHNLPYLNKRCVQIDNNFQNLMTVCGFLNMFSNDIRYPHKYQVNENDVNFAINAVEKIRNFKPFFDLRNIINKDGMDVPEMT